MRVAAAMANSAAAARTSLIAWASAWAIFSSAMPAAPLDRLGELLAGLGGEGFGFLAGLAMIASASFSASRRLRS
jgi:hypothetical protein